jgi:hypothetical protein
MLKNKCIGAMLLAAAAVSSTAMADDRGVNTVVGALAGAAIGGGVGGRNGAIVGGVIGAAVGNSARTNDDYYYRNRGYAYSGGYSNGYYQQAPAYVESRPVYVESRPVYVGPQRYYYDARPDVVVVERGRGYDHDRGWHRGWDHDRGWDRGGDRDHDRGGWRR